MAIKQDGQFYGWSQQCVAIFGRLSSSFSIPLQCPVWQTVPQLLCVGRRPCPVDTSGHQDYYWPDLLCLSLMRFWCLFQTILWCRNAWLYSINKAVMSQCLIVLNCLGRSTCIIDDSKYMKYSTHSLLKLFRKQSHLFHWMNKDLSSCSICWKQSFSLQIRTKFVWKLW